MSNRETFTKKGETKRGGFTPGTTVVPAPLGSRKIDEKLETPPKGKGRKRHAEKAD